MKAYIGRDAQLAAFQKAVKEEIGDTVQIEGRFALTFLFWRNLATYEIPSPRDTSKGVTQTKHEVDVTNMQKATEDALQGVLFKNDNSTREVHSYLIEQGPEVRGRIVIGIEPLGDALPDILNNLPQDVYLQLKEDGDPKQLAMFDQLDKKYQSAKPIF